MDNICFAIYVCLAGLLHPQQILMDRDNCQREPLVLFPAVQALNSKSLMPYIPNRPCLQVLRPCSAAEPRAECTRGGSDDAQRRRGPQRWIEDLGKVVTAKCL